MDVYVYLISASYVNARRFAELAETLVAAAPCAARAVRLEGSGDSLWRVLDELLLAGATRVELRPIGLPFSQSLERWLPDAAAGWLARQVGRVPALYFCDSPQGDARVAQAAARAQVQARPIAPKHHGERGKGWDNPPEHRHHLLVCTGPRCHLRDAPNLVDALKSELGRAGIASDCLVTTTGCLFPCNTGPVIVHYPQGHWYRVTDAADITDFVAQALCQARIPQHLLIHKTGAIHEPA